MRVALSLHLNQVRPDEATSSLRSGPHSKRASNLARKRGCAQQQVMNRTSQREWLEPARGQIFHEAQTHNPSDVPTFEWICNPETKVVNADGDSSTGYEGRRMNLPGSRLRRHDEF